MRDLIARLARRWLRLGDRTITQTPPASSMGIDYDIHTAASREMAVT